jgi:ribosome maturation protein SDO1|eukprot:gnl/Ergobibamus_cyprinoides/685.p2 GENE.gnl/Ergobibamus_cyprinoides/685~~gnl/Ergobibamus_cyprinoides/685.p2  ORF type:complete len:257 (+),score=66.07 gnl/Ergobibamus_cyprinoides/685:23-772(+)
MARGGRVVQPVSQKWLTNVAVVRMNKGGARFEIACYKNKVQNWRSKAETDINEVLQIETVFSNVARGLVAPAADLQRVFGTSDHLQACRVILDEGVLQVSDRERAASSESVFKEVARHVAAMTVNPVMREAYAPATIERAMQHDIHFAVHPTRPAKAQALQVIADLQAAGVPIARSKMRIRIRAGKAWKAVKKDLVAAGADVEREEFDAAGGAEATAVVEPGLFRVATELVAAATKNTGSVELIEFHVG